MCDCEEMRTNTYPRPIVANDDISTFHCVIALLLCGKSEWVLLLLNGYFLRLTAFLQPEVRLNAGKYCHSLELDRTQRNHTTSLPLLIGCARLSFLCGGISPSLVVKNEWSWITSLEYMFGLTLFVGSFQKLKKKKLFLLARKPF